MNVVDFSTKEGVLYLFLIIQYINNIFTNGKKKKKIILN